MGKFFPCCFSGSNTNPISPLADGSQSIVSLQSGQPGDIPESSSAPGIKSILKSIQKENTPEHIDKLIQMLDALLSKIKGEGGGEELSISSRVENLVSTTTTAAEVLDFVSSEANNIGEMDISKELGSVTTTVLDAIAGTHFIFLGLAVVAHSLERYLQMKTNYSACKILLEELVDLAKEVKKFKEAVHGESWKVCKAMFEIVVGAKICCDYINRGQASRFWKAGIMESQLQKTKEMVRDLRASLTFTTVTHVAATANKMDRRLSYIGHQTAMHSGPSPSEPLDFHPEGIEDGVAKVTELLDIGGSEQARAVVIVGIGGIGKSTLAASVIQSLKLSSTDFKYSKVTIDQKTPDKRSHIVGLQKDIIHNFTDSVQHLQDPEQGRRKMQEAMKSKFCFLYIDNVVDSYYMKELLPRELIPHNPSEEKSEEQLKASSNKSSAESSQNQMQKTKIRILITSRQNDFEPFLNINIFEHEVSRLSVDKAQKFVSAIILGGDKPADDLDELEERKINELAEACLGVPLLLSIFGNHLKDNREKNSYDRAIKALKEGNLDRYSAGDEELLSERLMFVYDQLKDEQAQEAFLDICSYLQGRPWDQVADMVDSDTLAILHKKKMVNKSEAGKVIVHDILRLMGAKKAKDTRLMNYEEFFHINDDESKLKSVKGLQLMNSTFLATLETRHLNAMRHSLRYLALGDWVRVDGPPCDRAFKKLRCLQVGDLKDFPFKDVSKMEKLNRFWNESKPGMELAQLPPSLKRLTHKISSPDSNDLARIHLKNLKSLKWFTIETKRSVRLPQGFKLPESLQHLRLNSCEQLPEKFGHLSALETLILDKCDLKCLPQELTQSVQLRYLSLQHCTNMISLPDNIFPSLCLLTDLRLMGCTHLEKLPADFGTLTALRILDIRECEKLTVLPQNFGQLKSLKTLRLDGCISLQGLPDSFGMLRIEHLTLESLASLKELPQSIGDLSCLHSLTLKSCHSLEFVPDSFAKLTNLGTLKVKECIKLGALPNNFEQLSSLKNIIFSGCPLLRRLPDGFEALKTLIYMKLKNCSSLVHLPTCFEMLACLEELYLIGLFFSSFPDGIGKLKKLKNLEIDSCCSFQTLPQDFENLASLEWLSLCYCHMLEGTTMDKVVKLQNCHYVGISGSTKLKERWNELKENNENLPMIVHTSSKLDEHRQELDRAGRVGLLCGKCIQLDSTTNKLINYSSLSIPNNTTIAVISTQLDQRQLFQQTVDMAKERARTNCAGQLRIIYVCRRSVDSDAPHEADETEKIRQTLMMLPQEIISYAIPSTDIRRLSLIGRSIFDNPYAFNDGTGPKLLCFMVDAREDDEGRQILKDGKCVAEDEISKKKSDEKLPISENSEEEIEISDGIVEFINCICESETQRSSGQGSPLREENMIEKFVQKLKNDNIHHFSDSKVKVDHLQGKSIAIILIDPNYPECRRLQQVYQDIKLKDSNFEAIWIPLPKEKDFGFGTYSRAIEYMPWLTLADPKLIKIDDIKDNSPRVIIINSGGSIGNTNALSLLMSWGADAYLFTKASLSQLELKSTLEILFHSSEIKELNKKLIFLYAEPPSQKLKIKCTLEKLLQIHGKGNYEIVYVGRFFAGRKVAENLQKAYEDATESMNWSKLSFEDMMTFWYRCQYLSKEVGQEPNSTFNGLVKTVLKENRWLVVVDGDGMVSANGIDLVELACESSDEKDNEVDIAMKEELAESLKEGKCKEGVRSYFRDELNHPQHHHPLRTWKENKLYHNNEFYCDGCALSCVYASYGKRIYRCDDCGWDLCWDCWKEFVKEEMKSV